MHFLKDENGAVTVDWVVLTAATMGLGLAVVAVLGTGFSENSDSLGTAIAEIEVAPGFAPETQSTTTPQSEPGTDPVL